MIEDSDLSPKQQAITIINAKMREKISNEQEVLLQERLSYLRQGIIELYELLKHDAERPLSVDYDELVDVFYLLKSTESELISKLTEKQKSKFNKKYKRLAEKIARFNTQIEQCPTNLYNQLYTKVRSFCRERTFARYVETEFVRQSIIGSDPLSAAVKQELLQRAYAGVVGKVRYWVPRMLSYPIVAIVTCVMSPAILLAGFFYAMLNKLVLIKHHELAKYLFIPAFLKNQPSKVREVFTEVNNFVLLVMRKFFMYPLQGLVVTAVLPLLFLGTSLFYFLNGFELSPYQKKLKESTSSLRWVLLPLWKLRREDKDRAFLFYGVFDFLLFFTMISLFAFSPNIPMSTTKYQFFWVVIFEGAVRLPQLLIEMITKLRRLKDEGGEYTDPISGITLKTKARRAFERLDIVGNFLASSYACGSVFILVCINMWRVWSKGLSQFSMADLHPAACVIFISSSLALLLYSLGKTLTKGAFFLGNSGVDRYRYKKEFVDALIMTLTSALTLVTMLAGQGPGFIAAFNYVFGTNLMALQLPALLVTFGNPLCAASLLAGIFNLIIDVYVQPHGKAETLAIKAGLATFLAALGAILWTTLPAVFIAGAAYTIGSGLGVACVTTATLILGIATVKFVLHTDELPSIQMPEPIDESRLQTRVVTTAVYSLSPSLSSSRSSTPSLAEGSEAESEEDYRTQALYDEMANS